MTRLITPCGGKHINPFGKYHFDLERMRQTADPSPGETLKPLTEVFGWMWPVRELLFYLNGRARRVGVEISDRSTTQRPYSMETRAPKAFRGSSSNRVKIYCSVLYAKLTPSLAPVSGQRLLAHVIT
jgi:hypothetical protein